MSIFQPQTVNFFVKVTKFCNLRCKYCYEYPYLSDKRKIEEPEARKMFVTLAKYFSQTGQNVHFIWHGGEPFVLPPAYYQNLFEIQATIFGEYGVTYENSVQTNLTILHQDWLDALKNDIFDAIGVSIDMIGDDRVNVAGKPMDDKVLDNMQKLIDNGITFGTITVLSAKTQPHILDIYRFFCEINTPCSLIPIQKNAAVAHHDFFSLAPQAVVAAYIALFETWLTAENAVLIDPIEHYINSAIKYLNPNKTLLYYQKAVSDSLFIINTDGKIYGDIYANNFDTDAYYGNIFEESFEDILKSEVYQQVVAASDKRLAQICGQCPFWGACMGDAVGKGSLEDLTEDENGQLTCQIIRPFLAYATEKLVKDQLVEFTCAIPQ